jgi:hypothetical protein
MLAQEMECRGRRTVTLKDSKRWRKTLSMSTMQSELRSPTQSVSHIKKWYHLQTLKLTM